MSFQVAGSMGFHGHPVTPIFQARWVGAQDDWEPSQRGERCLAVLCAMPEEAPGIGDPQKDMEEIDDIDDIDDQL